MRWNGIRLLLNACLKHRVVSISTTLGFSPYRSLACYLFWSEWYVHVWINKKSLCLSDCWRETAVDRPTSWKERPAVKQAITRAPHKTHKSVWCTNTGARRTIKCPCNRRSNRQGERYLFGIRRGHIFNCYCSSNQNFYSKLALKRHHKPVAPSLIASPRLPLASPLCDFSSKAEESVSECSVWFSAI